MGASTLPVFAEMRLGHLPMQAHPQTAPGLDMGQWRTSQVFLYRGYCRRYYIESIPLDNKIKDISGSKGAEGWEYINCLYKVEVEIKYFPYREKSQKRQEASRSILDVFLRGYKKLLH